MLYSNHSIRIVSKYAHKMAFNAKIDVSIHTMKTLTPSELFIFILRFFFLLSIEVFCTCLIFSNICLYLVGFFFNGSVRLYRFVGSVCVCVSEYTFMQALKQMLKSLQFSYRFEYTSCKNSANNKNYISNVL